MTGAIYLLTELINLSPLFVPLYVFSAYLNLIVFEKIKLDLEQAGANTVKNILYGLERLEVFPEAGFDADERVGGIIYPPHKTRCIILGDYLAFYHILEDRKAVFVSDIIHSKQDYIRLFKKK